MVHVHDEQKKRCGQTVFQTKMTSKGLKLLGGSALEDLKVSSAGKGQLHQLLYLQIIGLYVFNGSFGQCWFCWCVIFFDGIPITPPKTNIAPENGWLEYYSFLFGWPILRCYVSFREGMFVVHRIYWTGEKPVRSHWTTWWISSNFQIFKFFSWDWRRDQFLKKIELCSRLHFHNKTKHRSVNDFLVG